MKYGVLVKKNPNFNYRIHIQNLILISEPEYETAQTLR